jgi:putative hydrolase of the HAD superfamily
LEDVLERIFRTHNCYSKELVDRIVKKRMDVKRECFKHLNPQIIPMLTHLKDKDIRIGLISNCYSEEVGPIKESILYPYFDAVCLSYEVGMKKPDKKIYIRCMKELSVESEECLYVGDGGSNELEGAKCLGMRTLKATWYLSDKEASTYGNGEFIQIKEPLEVLNYVNG